LAFVIYSLVVSSYVDLHVPTAEVEQVQPTQPDPPRTELAADLPFLPEQTVFVGRQAYLTRLNAALGDAFAHRPRLVLIDGPAGIGKTALVHRFVRTAKVGSLLQASGDETETRLGFGVVEQLVAHLDAPLPDQFTGLGDPGGRQADPLAVGAALLDLLGHLQEDGPVLITVDDAHWADPPSLQALTFALRRLHFDQVLALVTTRDADDQRLPNGLRRALSAPAGLHLSLGGLTVTEVRALSRQLAEVTLTPRAAARLREHTAGNPLHVRALLEELSAEVLRDPGLPLPAPRSFTMLVLRRLAACRPETQQLVLAAAILGTSCRLALAARLAGLDDPLAALDGATAARMLEERRPEVVGCPHPLVRAAVDRDLSAAQRARLHARAAVLVDGPATALRHRIAASGGADAALAAEVAAFAQRQATAGGWLAAAEHLRAAARLDPDPAGQERHLLEAAACLLQAGEIAEAGAMRPELERCGDGPWRRYVLGYLAAASGLLDQGAKLLEDAWTACDRTREPRLAGRIAAGLMRVATLEAPGRSGARWAYRALRLAPQVGHAASALDFLLFSLCEAGHPRLGRALAARLPEPRPDGHPGELDGLFGRGTLRLWTDDVEGALADLGTVAAAYRRHGPVDFAVVSCNALADAQFRAGAWDDAITQRELGISLAEDAAQQWLIPFLRARAACPYIGRGQWEQADAYLRPPRTGSFGPHALMWLREVEAFRASARNDPEGVVAALDPVLEVAGDAPGHFGNQPGVLEWRDIYAEALTALGRLDHADRVLRPLEELATRHAHRSALVSAARARGVLEAARGQPSASEAAFRAGLALADGLRRPFTVARLELAYGGFLRRAGRRAAAAEQLAAAHARLAELDAHPWLARCKRELAACGRVLSSEPRSGRPTLTTQELAVARLAAAGLSNRQIATQLVVSVKTVEYHLGKVYPKLGVTSRTQLAARLRQD